MFPYKKEYLINKLNLEQFGGEFENVVGDNQLFFFVRRVFHLEVQVDLEWGDFLCMILFSQHTIISPD